ncbi:MAG: hypothetical protein ACXVAV_09520 [Ktedonobacteraceae bacterium]
MLMKDIAFERTSQVSVESISSHIKFPLVGNLPRILLAVAPCRSGTTVQLRMFSATGIPSYYQPLKAIMRREAQGMEGDFEIPQEDTIFIKETLGPYSHAESIFNPLDVLLQAGYPKDKITLLIEMREPLSTLTSWIEADLPLRENRTALFVNFITAYKTIPQVLRQAQESEIQLVPYLYEAQRDTDPANAAAGLFSSLHLVYTDSVVAGWEYLPQFGTAESKIFYPLEPSLYRNDSQHDVAATSQRLSYTKKAAQSIDDTLLPAEVAIIEQEGLPVIYEQMRELVAIVLGMHIQPSTEVEQYKMRLSGREAVVCQELSETAESD